MTIKLNLILKQLGFGAGLASLSFYLYSFLMIIILGITFVPVFDWFISFFSHVSSEPKIFKTNESLTFWWGKVFGVNKQLLIGSGRAFLYSLSVAYVAFFLAIILAILIASMTLPFQQRHIAAVTWLSLIVVAIPPMTIMTGFQFFYQEGGFWHRLGYAITKMALSLEAPVNAPMDSLDNFPFGVSYLADLTNGGFFHIMGIVLKELPFLLLMLLLAWRRLPLHYGFLGSSLQYDAVMSFFRFQLPSLLSLNRFPMLLSLLYGFNNLEAGLLLGPANPPSMPLLLYQIWQSPNLNVMPTAEFLGLWLVLANIFCILSFWLISKLIVFLKIFILFAGHEFTFTRYWNKGIYGYYGFIGFHVICLLLLLLSGLAVHWYFPKLLPTISPINASGFSLLWRHNDLIIAMGFSLLIGLLSALISSLLFLWWVEQDDRAFQLILKKTLGLLLLPLLVADIVLAQNILQLVRIWYHGQEWLAFILVLFFHVAFGLGLMLLLLRGYQLQIPKDIDNLALSLGLSPVKRFWRIKLPYLCRPLLFNMALVLAVSIGLYVPSVLLGGGRIPALSLQLIAYQLSSDVGGAAAAGFLLLLLPLLGYGLAQLLSHWRLRKFSGM